MFSQYVNAYILNMPFIAERHKKRQNSDVGNNAVTSSLHVKPMRVLYARRTVLTFTMMTVTGNAHFLAMMMVGNHWSCQHCQQSDYANDYGKYAFHLHLIIYRSLFLLQFLINHVCQLHELFYRELFRTACHDVMGKETFGNIVTCKQRAHAYS